MIDIKSLLKLIVVGFLVTLIVIAVNMASFKRDRNEFRLLRTSDTVNGVVKFSKVYQGVVFVEMEMNNKFRIRKLEDDLNKPSYADNLLLIGDSIYKRRYTDTIYIYRKGEGYCILMDTLGYGQ